MRRYTFLLLCLGVSFYCFSLSMSEAAEVKAPVVEEEGGAIEESAYMVSDPFEPWNRAVFSFNNFVYFKCTEPFAEGYAAVVPKPARTGIKNFFRNLGFPIRFINEVLQGKIEAAQQEMFSFIVNSTFGVGGFFDPASRFETLATYDEDTGQTLGRWGIGQGFYIVWPLLGPSTLRDSFGFAGDYFLDPVSYVNPIWLSFSVRGYEVINDTSLVLGEYESLLESSFDPYVAVKDAYLQHRRSIMRK